jgi:hypothetical protein
MQGGLPGALKTGTGRPYPWSLLWEIPPPTMGLPGAASAGRQADLPDPADPLAPEGALTPC